MLFSKLITPVEAQKMNQLKWLRPWSRSWLAPGFFFQFSKIPSRYDNGCDELEENHRTFITTVIVIKQILKCLLRLSSITIVMSLGHLFIGLFSVVIPCFIIMSSSFLLQFYIFFNKWKFTLIIVHFSFYSRIISIIKLFKVVCTHYSFRINTKGNSIVIYEASRSRNSCNNTLIF